jgi:hypothetical protein
MRPSHPLPQPPVPQRLREILKDYPDLIQRLQEGLNKVITKPVRGTPPFEVAIWTLEDALSVFIFEARGELETAEADGDPVAIKQADSKIGLMLSARSSGGGMRNLSELQEYFQVQTGAFR